MSRRSLWLLICAVCALVFGLVIVVRLHVEDAPREATALPPGRVQVLVRVLSDAGVPLEGA